MTAENQDPFIDRVRATIDEFDLLSPGARVLVALSGGADSMALLHALLALGVPVDAAHLNHMLRDDASDADQAFVLTHCAELGVTCHCASDDVGGYALDSGQSIEAAARERRYEFLTGIAALNGIDTVATGHHADDQAETILMRVLRGAGLAGLAGIPPRRQDDTVAFVRPLFRSTRDEIIGWLESEGIPWREDASNQDAAPLRNRVRHALLPQLATEYNPQLRAALCRMADNLRDDAALLDAMSDAAAADTIDEDGALNPESFSPYPEAIQRRVIQQWLWYAGADLDSDALRRAVHFVVDAGVGKYFDAGAGLRLYRGREGVEIVSDTEADAAMYPLALPGETIALGHRFTLHLRDVEAGTGPEREAYIASLRRYCNPARQVFDADAIGTDLAVRTRRDGDRFRPLGMDGTRKLQDYFVDCGVPAPGRNHIPLIVAGDRIAWVAGGAMDAAFALTADTRRILEIEVSDAIA